MESLIIESLLSSGSGMLMAVLVLWGIYRLVERFGVPFIQAEQSQASALTDQSRALMELTRSLKGYIERDTSEHREMLVLLKFIAQQQSELQEVRIEHERRKEQAHPYCPARTPQD